MRQQNRYVQILITCLSDGHVISLLEFLKACEFSASECDGLTCCKVVSATEQDFSVAKNIKLWRISGGCADSHAAPNFINRISRVYRNMNACLEESIQRRINQQNRSSKTKILVLLKSRPTRTWILQHNHCQRISSDNFPKQMTMIFIQKYLQGQPLSKLWI